MVEQTEKKKWLPELFYSAGDAVLVKDRRRAKNLLHRLNVTEYQWQKKHGKSKVDPKCRSEFYVEPPFHCDYGYNITCGENVYFNVNCVV
jgi:maltose O-acetyltransferase